jgi:hypothetical protein
MTAWIRDRVRRQNAVTIKHQQAIYTEKLRPSEHRLEAQPPKRPGYLTQIADQIRIDWA